MKKGFYKIKNIKFRERMLLIYIIGGIIPFFAAILYSNSRSRTIMLDQTRRAESEEISLIGSSISQSMRVAEQVSGHIYGDEEVRQIMSRLKNKEYKNGEEFDRDCRKMDFIDEYTDYFQEDIASIKIYVQDVTSISNHYITFIDGDDFSKKTWYDQTYSYRGTPYWSYDYDDDGVKKLQLTRCIPNERGEILGVLQIFLQQEKIMDKLKQREATTAVLFQNENAIAKNSRIGDIEKYIIDGLQHLFKNNDSQLINYKAERYLYTYQRIYGSSGKEFYTIISMQNYHDIMSQTRKTNFVGVTTLLIGLVISVGLILFFSSLFENRSQMLFEQMHLVAKGEYDKVKPLEGTDEVGMIYGELEKMMKEIQVLTERVVHEQVLKEKFHTRQMEVEFKMLADQINPHFIYNTLETIRMKAKINHEPEIEELVKMLAKIMRRNIQAGAPMVSLKSELELTENYLAIQKYRFGDRIVSQLTVDENVDPECQVIPLIIQPFVENAFVHGLESVDRDGLLQIHVKSEDGKITIIIEDNGAGIERERMKDIRRSLREGAASESSHVGINNVNQRIHILYGDRYGVSMQSFVGKGTKVTLRFPEIPPEDNITLE